MIHLSNEAYLAVRQAELASFELKCIQARQINKIVCAEHRLGFGLFIMTPQEELFAGFFKAEKILVKDMTILELRAHREELAKIAFEARARLTAADDEERERKSKGTAKGFSTSLATDEITTSAINTIKARGERQSKAEKLLAGLIKLGIDPKAAGQLMSAGTALGQIKKSQAENATPEEIKQVTNPFKNKIEPTQIKEDIDEDTGLPIQEMPVKQEQPIEISINEDTNTITVTKEVEKPTFVNPFAK